MSVGRALTDIEANDCTAGYVVVSVYQNGRTLNIAHHVIGYDPALLSPGSQTGNQHESKGTQHAVIVFDRQ